MAAAISRPSGNHPRPHSQLQLDAPPLWNTDGADLPNRSASRFVAAGNLRWHVQIMGHGPVLLLLHGTGASTHSWADLAPLLAKHYTVVAPDLPGHGFTEPLPARRLSLPGMAEAVAQLVQALDVKPALAVGHSAGAAILIRMTLDARIAPRAIVSLNGALLPFTGLAGVLFLPLARLLSLNPLVPRFFAWRALDRRAVERLVQSTGSTLNDRQLAFYIRLLRNAAHVQGALDMMANWDLRALAEDLPRLEVPLTLVAAERDGTVPPTQAEQVRALLPTALVVRLAGLGHLAHEEDAARVAALIQKVDHEPR
ncbi:MAG: alpha/beta fold hydrolase [Burkholderiales bacterium]|nr:alpha/beta fold hydrolase [Burkholderiales bacterium]